ncbi:MAG: dihydrofolate reductase family protein [Acidobacteria bacterium]|nr:dihydrofolate reductase family protein [Acidobacteriota bacterium]
MRRIRYQVAASLDGYIAGPKGEADWIIADSEIDFTALFAQFDTLLIGRRTFEAMGHGGNAGMPGMKVFVFSQSLRQSDYPGITIITEKSAEAVTSIKALPGKDIWLFGGGILFRSLLEAGLVDTVEIAIIPVLLGEGIPLLPATAKDTRLKLTGHKVYSKSGIVLLEYAVT